MAPELDEVVRVFLPTLDVVRYIGVSCTVPVAMKYYCTIIICLLGCENMFPCGANFPAGPGDLYVSQNVLGMAEKSHHEVILTGSYTPYMLIIRAL